MVENLECRRFRNRLDAFMDNELSASEREEMLRHARACSECDRILKEYQDMLGLLATIDEDIVVPPEVAQGWRSAVRDEAERDRKHSGRGWIRALSSMAAAFVLLLGMTGLYRSGFNPAAGSTIGVQNVQYAAGREETEVYSDEAAQDDSFETVAMDSGRARTRVIESDGAAETGDVQTTQQEDEQSHKLVVIRSATRTMESTVFEADSIAIDTLVGDYGGWFGYRALSGKSFTEGGSGRTAELSVRIPTETMDDFLTDLKQIGATVYMTDSADDVSSVYYDRQGRLDALYAQRARLTELIAQAADLADMIELEDKLYEVQSEIDILEGEQRDTISRAQYSRISITLTEVQEYSEPETTDRSLSARISKGFADSIRYVKTFLQDMLVAVVTFSPALVVIIPMILIVCLLVRSIRRRRNRRM